MQYDAADKKTDKKDPCFIYLEGTDLENVESIKYLGVTITSDLRWNTHVSNVCTKANRTLGFLRRNLYSCPQGVKEAAYKGLVRTVLDYASFPTPHPHPSRCCYMSSFIYEENKRITVPVQMRILFGMSNQFGYREYKMFYSA